MAVARHAVNRATPKPGDKVVIFGAGPIGLGAAIRYKRSGAGHVAVHKKPVEIDLGGILNSEVNLVISMGYPTEIFEVTKDIVAEWEKYARIISDTFDFADVDRARALAATPGAADKVVVTFS
jgi:threonine dehydrogenase-like Zn-dependent dehydrogenase